MMQFICSAAAETKGLGRSLDEGRCGEGTSFSRVGEGVGELGVEDEEEWVRRECGPGKRD